jgi:hypothetical protein
MDHIMFLEVLHITSGMTRSLPERLQVSIESSEKARGFFV